MASKAGKKKDAIPVATSVAETIVGGAPALVVQPNPPTYSPAPTATAPPRQPEVPRPPTGRDPETPSLPTHLEVLETPLGDDPSPDELLAALNHVVLVGGIPKHQFDSIYLHHFSALGGTQETADQQWNSLLEKGTRERAAAQELARVMQGQALEQPAKALLHDAQSVAWPEQAPDLIGCQVSMLSQEDKQAAITGRHALKATLV